MRNNKVKKQISNKKFVIVWSSVMAFALALTIAVNYAMDYFSGYVNLYLGSGDMVVTKTEDSENWNAEYYPLDYNSLDEVNKAADTLVEKIESEGIVLLKNNGALPLPTPANITLLGRDAADPIYGGSGSGSVNLNSVVDLKKGLERANYSVNENVYSILSEYASYTMEDSTLGKVRAYKNPRANIAMDSPKDSSYYIGEMPVENYTSAVSGSFADYHDAAVVVFGRGGGEGGDLTTNMSKWDDNYETGQHQLELNLDEKQTLELAKKNFDKVIVIINSSNVMELGDLENDSDVDAILWVGSPGQTGFYAVGDVLCGNVTPSGKTVDIYLADLTKDPSFKNFGDYKYSNVNDKNASGDGYFVQYEEGVYVGYRYYETAAVEGFIDYDSAVVYPFGYGLSYTDFSWEVTSKKLGNDGKITVEVKVTNTGDTYSGKDVVELYYSAPYTKGGIEKAEVVLGDFAKTKLLVPGESETLTLAFAVENMASYDYKSAKAYVLEEGDYEITLRTDSHNVKSGTESMTYSVNKTIIYEGDNHRDSDKTAVTNQFDDVSAMFTDSVTDDYALNMSRADFEGTFPTAPSSEDKKASDVIIEGFAAYDTKANADDNAEMPTTNAKNGLSLIDMRGLAYDDPSWELFLDELSPDNMQKLVMNGAYTTIAVSEIGKPATEDYDGPAGISSYMTSLKCTSYPSEVVVASTWNIDIANKMGVMVGNEAIANNVTGWYAPGMNIHRNPFAGRNFEYYSEDPLLSGKMGTAVVSGAAEKGVWCTLKHFAANEQETNRVNNGVSSWVNEQALREIYLKPFELTVKNAKQTLSYISDENGTLSSREMSGATSVMSSFNRVGATWAGGSSALLKTVLRDEWGFEGLVITDFNLYSYMYPDQGIANGSDLMLTYDSMKSMEDTKSATALYNMRNASHNILYTISHSNAMNGIAPGTIITYTTAPWRYGLMIADVIIGVLLAVGIVLVSVRVMRKRKWDTRGRYV
jgi:beta-glucosidase